MLRNYLNCLGDERGSSIISAMIAVVLVGLGVAALGQFAVFRREASNAAVMSGSQRNFEFAMIDAIAQVFRKGTACSNLAGSLSPIAVDVDSGANLRNLTMVTASTPVPSNAGSVISAAWSACRPPVIPLASAKTPAHFCYVLNKPTAGTTAAKGGILSAQLVLIDVKAQFIRLVDKGALSCTELSNYSLGGGLQLDYTMMWQRNTSGKGTHTSVKKSTWITDASNTAWVSDQHPMDNNAKKVP